MILKSNKDCLSWAILKNINVTIDNKPILSNININLNYGENIVILGPNGSGKSTFLKLLNRSIYPIVSKNSSFKLFNNENINIWNLRKNIGFLFKEMEERVKKGITAYQLVESGFSGTFNSRSSKLLSKIDLKKIDDLAVELDIKDIIHQEFNSLSDGQKRRAMLARALVYKPNLLVLDEPFCNLDLKSSFILDKNLTRLIKESTNIVYVTHNLETIIPKTNRVILLKRGSIIKEGCPKQIINSRILSNLFDIPIKVIKQGHYWRATQLIN